MRKRAAMPPKPFNLIHEHWLPVRRSDGTADRIAPWQITDNMATNAVVALDWPRPDFNGASLEFLIGLLATAYAPRDLDGWLARWEKPPSPRQLRDAFDEVAFAFNLDGDGPRFMQDLGGFEHPDERRIAALLIEQPGEQGIEHNIDLFVKRGGIVGVSRASAAIALFTAQTYSPQGGRGYLVSLRGGGPLTTLIVADAKAGTSTLWRQLWPNVPARSSREWRSKPEQVFPWLAPTRSAAKFPATTPRHGHFLQIFWSMPRRVRLIFEPAGNKPCDLGGPTDRLHATWWETKPYGVKYVGWEHPLSPYVKSSASDAARVAVKARPGCVSYRHWLGLVQTDREQGRQPAACVNAFLDGKEPRIQACSDIAGVRLVGFGYDMEQMKARCWYQSAMPVPMVDSHRRKAFDDRVAQLVRAADMAAGLTRAAVKRARFSRPSEATGDFSVLADRFWHDTEATFFACLSQVAEGNPDDPAHRERWHGEMRRAALAIFDDAVPSAGLEEGAWRRVVEARRWLVLGLNGKSIRSKLGLAVPARKVRRVTEEVGS